MAEKEVRPQLMFYVLEDWERLIDGGLTPREARVMVENDYELVEAEKLFLNTQLLTELEQRMEMKK